MKTIILVFVIVACVLGSSSAQILCHHKKPSIPEDWITMVDPCVDKMRKQIQQEITAAMQYMAMGAHFSRDTQNRPGFAKLFFEAASEERQHAIKLISYLLMRGGLTRGVSNLIRAANEPETITWQSGLEALKDALKLEAKVTRKIRDVIQYCETNESDFNDYHLVDYLRGEFLAERYKGQKDLAIKISTLDKMIDKHGGLAEFLFDKKLLEA